MKLAAPLLLCCAVGASAWRAPLGGVGREVRTTAYHSPSHPPVVMLAKKKSKPRKPPKPSGSAGGAASGLRPTAVAPPPRPSTLDAPPAAAPSDAPLDSRLDQVLRDAGITRTADDAAEAARGPADPLSRIPKKGQELLERFFGGGAIVFGSAFLLSGLAVSVEAICKVLGTPLPTAIDQALIQYVEPALTPSVLILFFFSISLGTPPRGSHLAMATCCLATAVLATATALALETALGPPGPARPQAALSTLAPFKRVAEAGVEGARVEWVSMRPPLLALTRPVLLYRSAQAAPAWQRVRRRPVQRKR